MGSIADVAREPAGPSSIAKVRKEQGLVTSCRHFHNARRREIRSDGAVKGTCSNLSIRVRRSESSASHHWAHTERKVLYIILQELWFCSGSFGPLPDPAACGLRCYSAQSYGLPLQVSALCSTTLRSCGCLIGFQDSAGGIDVVQLPSYALRMLCRGNRSLV